MTGCFFHFRNSYSGDRKSRHFTVNFEVAAFSISRSNSNSYKIMKQSAGRIDRLNTPFKDLYYYHMKSRSGIDLGISRSLKDKKDFNETKFVKWSENTPSKKAA